MRFSYYATRYLVKRAGFVSGWNYWFNYILVSMVELSVVGSFVNYWFPAIPQWVSAAVFLVVIAAMNLLGGEQVRRVRILVRDHQDRRGDSDDRQRARGTDCRTANGFRRQGELLELVRARSAAYSPTACCSKVPTANGPDC